MLLDLDQIEPHDRPRVGGKGMHLARLARRGLPVPPAVVIPVEVFGAALRAAGLWERAEAIHRQPDPEQAAALREAIRTIPLPGSLEADLLNRAPGLGERLAVRSSGVDEDGRVRSFAGQHETLLGVLPGAVADAVREVWSSLYAPGALAYREGRGRGPDPGGMAIVVQRLVEPRVSGVLFTVNPLSGSWREMTVEATWGLGEGLVSGQVTPHWYLVRRPRRAPRKVQRITSRVRLNLVQQDLPEIREVWEVDDRGHLVRRPTPGILRYRATLDKRTLMRLCRLGLWVEWELGEPQDVEWALDHGGKLHVLQARPITSTGTPRPRQDVLWTRRFIGERWTEPATPLGWSLIAPILEHFIAYPGTQQRYLGGGPALRLVRSRPYLNVSAFRHLAFKLPGAPPPQFMLELMPPTEELAWQRRFTVLPDVSVYLSFLRETLLERRWERFEWNPFTNPARWEDFEERLTAELPAVSRTPVSPADAVRLVRAQRDLVRDYVGIHICSLLFANLFYQVLDGTLAAWVPERAASLMRRLTLCPTGNRTLQSNEALWDLAGVAEDAQLEALERGERPDPDTPFGARLGTFLREYGHRSQASWEIMAPRWAVAPERLVPFLRAQRQASEEPVERARRQVEDFEQARAELHAVLRGPRRWTADMLVRYTRAYLFLRENQRFAFDRLLYAMQRTLAWLGEDFAREGWIARPDDIAYLTWSEVTGLASGSLASDPVPEWVERRRRKRDEDVAVEPPVFLRGDEGVTEGSTGARLQGLGISPGRHRGKVRVVHTPADGERLRPGEVLVARAVDPGWTPLLLSAGAVVLEMGSRLSHGAVVAREYGVPAVVNLEGVTRRLEDGAEVTVDGTRGVVWVHP